MKFGHGTFFTSIGCMDGRAQGPIAEYGKNKFGAEFPDTITEAGLDGLLAKSNDENFLESLKRKILISAEKHNSRGVIIHGHEDCAGNPVDEDTHRDDIKKCVERVGEMLGGNNIEVVGVFVKLDPEPKIGVVT